MRSKIQWNENVGSWSENSSDISDDNARNSIKNQEKWEWFVCFSAFSCVVVSLALFSIGWWFHGIQFMKTFACSLTCSLHIYLSFNHSLSDVYMVYVSTLLFSPKIQYPYELYNHEPDILHAPDLWFTFIEFHLHNLLKNSENTEKNMHFTTKIVCFVPTKCWMHVFCLWISLFEGAVVESTKAN